MSPASGSSWDGTQLPPFSQLMFRQFLARIVLHTGKVGEALVLQAGAGLLHTDLLTVTGAGFQLRHQLRLLVPKFCLPCFLS